MQRSARHIVSLLFLISGVSGLVLEVVWTRMLVAIFGNTVFAVSTVLAAFMTGLAVGSFAFGRMADRCARPLRMYAALELGIGLSAVLLTALLWNIDAVSVWVQRSLSRDPALLAVTRYLVSLGLMLPPTCLMGGTLPVLSRFAVERVSSLGRRVGVLYSLNTLGAAAGCYSAGFLLIGRMGLTRTAWAAAVLNVCVAGIAWGLSRSVGTEEAPDTDEDTEPASALERSGGGGKRIRILVLGAMGLSGFAALGYEVVWTKALVFPLGNSVYAFATMLTTLLAGLAIGGTVSSWLVDRGKRLIAALGIIEAGIGLYGILCVRLFAGVLGSQAPGPAGAENWSALALNRFFEAFRMLLLPTLLMGATFPVAARAYTASFRRVGRSVGSVYSVNTMGAVLGSLVAGFVFIPAFGLQNTLILLGLVNVGAGVVLCAAEPELRRTGRAALVCAAACAALAMVALTPQDLFRKALEQGRHFLFYREEVSGTVWVEEDPPDRRLVIDRRDVAGTDLRAYDSQKMLGHLPLLLHPAPKTVFALGFGAGGTCYSVSLHPGIERIDSAEFCPAVIEAARLLPDINHDIQDSPLLNLVVDDGRNFLATTDRLYDVISVDLLYPDAAGTGALYTRDFYEICRRRLNDGGLVAAWVPPHLLSLADVKVILRTCRSVFGHVALWHSPYYNCLLMVGSPAPLQIDFQRLKERMDVLAVREDMAEMGVADACTLLSYFIAHDDVLAAFARDSGGLNTDDLPIIEYNAPRDRNEHVEIARALLETRESPASLLIHLGDTPAGEARARERLRACWESMGAAQQAAIARMSGRNVGEVAALASRALELNPDNNAARLLLSQAQIAAGMALRARGAADQGVALLAEGLRADRAGAERWVARCREALKLDPNEADMHLALGIGLAGLGRNGEAMAEARTALRLKPGLPGAARFLAGLSGEADSAGSGS